MKKHWLFTTFLAIALCVICLALFPTEAKAASVDDLTFWLNRDGQSYTVSGCDTSASGELEIPATYNGKPVTSIGEKAFFCFRSLTSITIPDSVTSIGDSAFKHCTSLTSVTIGNSVTSIGEYAFCNCSSLTSVTIGNSVTSIGEYAFYGCSSLIGITIPDSVTSIGDSAFYDCSSLTSITIPDGATSIGYYAFEYCTSLTSITIPDSATFIGDYAFYRCSSLKNVYYSGSERKWNQISIGSGNNKLTGATIHYQHVHDYSLVPAMVVPATCTEAGYTEYTCAYGEKHRAEYVPALGHIMGINPVVFAPTCDSQGYTAIQCTRCSEISKTDYVDSLGHSMIYEAEKKATCTEDGHTAGTLCSRCGFLGTASKLEKGHSYKTITTKATLTKDGKIESKCSSCGNVTSTTVIKAPETFTLSTTDYTYNGTTRTPGVTIKDANGKTLVKGTDYTVSYPSGRTTLGTYTVTITMKGNYSGTKTLTFNIKLGTPNVTVSNATNGVKISWNAIAGAKNYKVYKSVYSGGKWSSWTAIKTGVTGTTYTDTSVKSNDNVKYTIRAFNGSYSSTYKSSSSIKFLATPTVTASNAATGVKISWNAIAGAKSYKVYKSVYSGGKWSSWVAIKTGVTGTTYTDTSVKSNDNVRYTVKAINGSFTSYIKASSTTKFLAQPAVKVAKATNGIKASWGKSAGATGYIVYRRTYSGGKWGSWASIKTTTALSYTDTTAKKGVTYQYTVRAYSGSYKSSFTNSVSIKR